MRYGSIRYVNNLPVDHGLLAGHVPRPDGLEVLEGHPAELNAAFTRGSVDVAAVSAAAVLRGLGDAMPDVLPEATIASHGPVDSVLLVSERPFDELDGRYVAVSEESATGALLLRILLERDVGVHPHYRPMRSDLPHMLREADAGLLIGDDALRLSAARRADPDRFAGWEVLDLGEAWRAYSGLPMVYALWVARAGLEGLAPLRESIVASREWAATHRDLIVAEAHARTGVDQETLTTYYGRLTHTLGPRELDGLRRFQEEAVALEPHPRRPDLIVPLQVAR